MSRNPQINNFFSNLQTAPSEWSITTHTAIGPGLTISHQGTHMIVDTEE